MADNDFNRTPIYALERPLCDDLNQNATYADQEVRDLLYNQTLTQVRTGTFYDASTPADGFLADGFKVRQNAAGANGNVYITSGMGFQNQPGITPANINGVTGLDDPSTLKPLILTANSNESSAGIPVPNTGLGAGNSRIDIIQVRANLLVTGPQSRDVLQPVTGVFAPQVLDKTLQWLLDNTTTVVQQPDTSTAAAIIYKKGIVTATTDPTVCPIPATTSGYVKIAEIFVQENATTFGTAVITDTRNYICQNGQMAVGGELSFTGDGANCKANLVRYSAPPGVVMGAYGEGGTNATVFLVIMAGETNFGSSDTVGVLPCAFPAAAFISSSVTATSIYMSANYVSIDAGAQASLQTAVITGTLISVAVNQRAIRIAFTIKNAASTATLGVGDQVFVNFNVLLNR